MKKFITGKAARGLLKLRKYSPEILVGVGVVSMVASTAFAIKGTLKVNDILEERDNDLDKVEQGLALENPEKYNEEDAKKDKLTIHAKAIGNLAKNYAPAIVTGVVGVTCVLSGFGIIRKRHIALAGAYKIVSESFEKYRDRVISKYGKEADREFKFGTIKQKVDKLDKKGKVIGEEEIEIVDPNGYSMYSRIFDETNLNWDKTPGYNRMFLEGQQEYCSQLLKSRGHLFLNEVYSMLGFQHSSEGAVVGWVYEGGEGDDFVDFGLYAGNERSNAFINLEERSIVLDFNVQGDIHKLI